MNHFYPGMGATSSMYGEPWRKELDGQFHDWPEWQGEQTITDIAKRIVEEHRVESGDTVFGTSLGGIIACEIANIIELERIILISLCTKKRGSESSLIHTAPTDWFSTDCIYPDVFG